MPDDLERTRRETPARTLAFFRALDFSRLDAALQMAHEPSAAVNLRDHVYRIFHSSWKMYHLRDAALEFAHAMLLPVGANIGTGRDPARTLAASMRRWHLDETLIDMFERTASTQWSKNRGAPDKWRQDARQLVAGFTVVREVALATLEAMDRMRKGDGFLFHPKAPLDPTDALFLEVWTDVGFGLRYLLFENEDLEDKCRGILRDHVRTKGSKLPAKRTGRRRKPR